MKGLVIDQQTQQPIPGAVVVALWHGSRGGPVQSTTVWHHVETAITDEHGAYEIKAWSIPNADKLTRELRNVRAESWAYAPGYEVAPRFENRPDVLVLNRFTGSSEKRLDYLFSEAKIQGGEDDNSVKNLIPLRLALSKEAHAIARSDEDLKFVQRIDWELNALCQMASERRPTTELKTNTLRAGEESWPPPPCTDAQLRKR